MPADKYPCFRTITANLSINPDEYEDVMNEVMVERSDRYLIISQPKKFVDKDGHVHVTMDVIDNGPT